MKRPACFVLMLLALAGPILRAATVTWTGVAGDGSWHTAANWEGGVVPGETDDVVLGGGDAVKFTAGTNTVRSVAAGRPVEVSGGLLTVTQPMVVNGGSVRLLSGGLSATVYIVGGTLALGANPSVPVSFVCQRNDGTGRVCGLEGDIGANVTVTVLGRAGSQSSGLTYGVDTVNEGTVILDSTGGVADAELNGVVETLRFVNRGTLLVRKGSGGKRSLRGAFENMGRVELEAGISLGTSGSFTQAGLLTVPDSAQFTQSGGTFRQEGGQNMGRVRILGGTLALGANPVVPVSFVCERNDGTGQVCRLEGDIGANVTVMVLGRAGSQESLLGYGVDTVNEGTVILDSVGGAADAVLRGDVDTLRFVNRGTVLVRKGSGGARSIRGAFENMGRVELEAGTSLGTSGTFTQAGLLMVPDSAQITQAGGTFTQDGGQNTGPVRILGGTLALGANPVVPVSFVCQRSDGTGRVCDLVGDIGANVTVTVLGRAGSQSSGLTYGADTVNEGTVILDSVGGSVDAYLSGDTDALRFVNRGTFRVHRGGGGARNFRGAFENHGAFWINDTVLTLSSGSMHNAVDGALAGSGGIVVASLFQNDGTIAPGASPGRLELVGNFLQTATGRLNLQLAGVQAGTGYDQFAVTGDATLGGTLNVGLADGFDPFPGDLFRLLTTGRLVGEFGNVNLPGLPQGRALAGQYSASGFEVKAEGNPAAVAPRIDAQPKDDEVFSGATVTFSVTATGTEPLTYQWRKNGVYLAGETRPTLTRTGVQAVDGGSYTVIVANEFGVLESEPAVLRVILDPLPFADNLRARGVISDASGEGVGSNRFATHEPGELRHAGKVGLHSVWLGWRAPQSGLATFRTTGSSFDTLLAVYTGTDFNSLAEVASDEDRGGFLTSEVRFNAVAGVEYLVAVDGFAGAGGDIVLSWKLLPTVEHLPDITLQPIGKVAVAGEAVTLVAAATPANAAFQWFANGDLLPGATGSTLQLPAVTPEQAGSYRLRVTAPNGLVAETRDALVEVSAAVGPVAFSADKLEDLFLDDAVAARAGIAPAGRPRPHGFTSLSSGSLTFNTRGAFTSPNEPLLCGGLGGASRWFRFRVHVAGDVTLGTTNTAFDTMVAVFTNRFNLTPVACNDDVIFGLKNSGVKFRAEPGVDYLVVVDGKGGDAGACTLTWKTGEAVPLLGNVLFLGFSDGRFRLEQEAANGPWELAAADAIGNWTSVLRTNVTDGVFRYTDPAPAERPARFYRLAPPAP